MSSKKRGSALIVDDSKFMHIMLGEILYEMGYSTISAYTGKDALKYYNENKPDLITLDINLPDIDGLEVIRNLKDENEECKVVMCTALSNEKFYNDSLELGANGFVKKPFTEDHFKNTVKDAVK